MKEYGDLTLRDIRKICNYSECSTCPFIMNSKICRLAGHILMVDEDTLKHEIEVEE
jgi:hypothetical protein